MQNIVELTIIIVNWNTRDLLSNCLNSIFKSIGKESAKIVVVDNASKDGSAKMIENQYPSVHLIKSGGNIGFAKANNLAMPYVDTPFVLFLNPDTLIIDNAISQMVSFLKNNFKVGALTCKIKCDPGQKDLVGIDQGTFMLGLQWFPTPITELITMFFLTDNNIRLFKKYLPYKNPHTSGFVSKIYGTCLMAKMDVLNKIGYFDEQFFMYAEDVDLSRRIVNDGWQLYYLSEAEIIHLSGEASSKASNQFSTLMTCESKIKLMKKYYGFSAGVLYRTVTVFGSLWRLVILYLMSVFSTLIGYRTENKKNAISKNSAMLKWAIFLQKTEIPQ